MPSNMASLGFKITVNVLVESTDAVGGAEGVAM